MNDRRSTIQFLTVPAALIAAAVGFFVLSGAVGGRETSTADVQEFQASLEMQMSDPGFRELLQRVGELQAGTKASNGMENMSGSVEDSLDPLKIRLPR